MSYIDEIPIICPDPDIETVSLLFILSEIYPFSNRILRQKSYEQTYKWADKKIDMSLNFNDVFARISIYRDVYESHIVRAEWLGFDDSSIKESPFDYIITVFGDLIINPKSSKNYETAPAALYDSFLMFTFATDTMKKIRRSAAILWDYFQTYNGD